MAARAACEQIRKVTLLCDVHRLLAGAMIGLWAIRAFKRARRILRILEFAKFYGAEFLEFGMVEFCRLHRIWRSEFYYVKFYIGRH